MINYQTENKKDLFKLPEDALKHYQRKFVNNVNLVKSYIAEHNYNHLLKYLEDATKINICVCQSVSFAEDRKSIKSYTSLLTSVIENPLIVFSSFNNEPQIIINNNNIPTMIINLACINDFVVTVISDNRLQVFFNYGEDGYSNMFIISIYCDLIILIFH